MLDKYLITVKKNGTFFAGYHQSYAQSAEKTYLSEHLRVIHIVSGKGYWKIENNIYEVHKGDVLVFNNVTPRQIVEVTSAPLVYEELWDMKDLQSSFREPQEKFPFRKPFRMLRKLAGSSEGLPLYDKGGPDIIGLAKELDIDAAPEIRISPLAVQKLVSVAVEHRRFFIMKGLFREGKKGIFRKPLVLSQK